MAEMSVKTGQGTWVKDPLQGHWRRASQREQAALSKGTAATVGGFLLDDLRSLRELGGIVSDMGQLEGAGAAFNQRMETLGGIRAESEELRRLRPDLRSVATGIGVVADPLNFLPFGRGARPAAETMAERVVRRVRVGEDAPSPAAPVSPAGLDPAIKSVGASEVTSPGGLKGLLDLIFEPGQLTPQQAALVPVGDKVGFKFLPGQRDGDRVFLESLQSHPVTAQAFAYELGTNADTLRGLVVKSLGLEGTTANNFTRDILRLARTEVGARFEKVRKALNDSGERIIMDPDDIALLDDITGALTPRQKRLINLADMDGKQAFEIRSRLNKRMGDMYSQGEKTAGDDLAEIIERIDESIGDAVGDAMMETWRTARQQWRVRLALKKPGVITSDGDVSLKRLAAELERGFEREFGETLIPDDAFRKLNPDITNLMDFVRVARSFASNLPDSGTATRQTIGRIMSGEFKELGAAFAVRKVVEGTALRP